MLRPPIFAVYGMLVLGSGVKFITDFGPTRIQVDRDALVSIGHFSVINPLVWIRARREVVIGDYVQIARMTDLFDSHLHPRYPGDPEAPKPVRIGAHTWIGVKSTILPGVQLGEHVIVGANSIVTKDVPAYTTVAGNPARVIRRREK